MKAARYLAMLALGVLSLAATPKDDSYTLNWKPSEGESLNYGLSVKFTVEGDSFEALSDVNVKVTKVEANGDYTVETLHKNNRVVVAGEEKKSPEADDEKPQVHKYSAKGTKISGEEPDDQDVLGNLLGSVGDLTPPEKPVQMGDKWTQEVKADEKKKVKAANIDYEVIGKSKIGDVDVVRVSLKYKETEGSKPPSYEGTLSLDLKDMSVVQVEASIENAPFDEGVVGQVRLKLTRN